jgi:DNA-directed RNA polymerase omega subunit
MWAAFIAACREPGKTGAGLKSFRFFGILNKLPLKIPARSRTTLDSFGNIDSKFRFVILASKRAKQLLKGAKPKIKAKSRNLIRIAQSEVKSGLIEFELIPTRKDDTPDQDERVFVGADIGPDDLGEPEVLVGKELVEEGTGKEIEGDVEEEEETDEEPEDGLKEEKDE